MQSVEILALKWRDCSTLVFALNNDHHPVRPLKWSQGTNNMHNCPNSDALQVFFYPKRRTSWHKLRRSISDNIPVRFSECDSNFLWVYKVFKISPFVNRRTFPLFQLALTHPSHHLNFGMNPDHARNSLSNCGIRQPKYGDRKVHHMYMRKKGLYFNVFLL